MDGTAEEVQRVRSLIKHRVIPDDDVIFHDGFLYIISQTRKASLDDDPEYKLDVLCLCPEYDDPLSLKDIAEKYPKVTKVIWEDWMVGKVFNYKNHSGEGEEAWEHTGETIGFV